MGYREPIGYRPSQKGPGWYPGLFMYGAHLPLFQPLFHWVLLVIGDSLDQWLGNRRK